MHLHHFLTVLRCYLLQNQLGQQGRLLLLLDLGRYRHQLSFLLLRVTHFLIVQCEQMALVSSNFEVSLSLLPLLPLSPPDLARRCLASCHLQGDLLVYLIIYDSIDELQK